MDLSIFSMKLMRLMEMKIRPNELFCQDQKNLIFTQWLIFIDSTKFLDVAPDVIFVDLRLNSPKEIFWTKSFFSILETKKIWPKFLPRMSSRTYLKFKLLLKIYNIIWFTKEIIIENHLRLVSLRHLTKVDLPFPFLTFFSFSILTTFPIKLSWVSIQYIFSQIGPYLISSDLTGLKLAINLLDK